MTKYTCDFSLSFTALKAALYRPHEQAAPLLHLLRPL